MSGGKTEGADVVARVQKTLAGPPPKTKKLTGKLAVLEPHKKAVEKARSRNWTWREINDALERDGIVISTAKTPEARADALRLAITAKKTKRLQAKRPGKNRREKSEEIMMQPEGVSEIKTEVARTPGRLPSTVRHAGDRFIDE